VPSEKPEHKVVHNPQHLLLLLEFLL